VSVPTGGGQADDYSSTSAISGRGRYVAFDSGATNLVPGDTNGDNDVFVHDRATGQTERASVSSSGAQVQGWSAAPSLSASGRFVAFESTSSSLVPNDGNNVQDIFVRDMASGTTIRASVSSTGAEANCLWDGEECAGGAEMADISGSGMAVVFMATSTNLVPDDTNRLADAFVHDSGTGRTLRVNVSSSGAPANSYSNDPHLSFSGSAVSYFSFATNLVPGDTNIASDIFVTGGVRRDAK
jgi:hypothetical protein